MTADIEAVAVAFALKRKGTPAIYVSTAGGAFQPARERARANLTITYDEDERRLPVSAKISYHRAFRMLRQETGHAMAVINASTETGAIYGIEEGRASTFSGPTLPLTYLVDLKLRTDARAGDGGPLLVAVFLGEIEKAGVPLLVIGVNPDRTMVLQDLVPSVADFNTTMTNILGAMAAAGALRGLDFDPRQTGRNEEQKRLEQQFIAERVLRTSASELAALAHNAKTYPREPVWRGMSQSRLAKCVLAGSSLVLAGSAGFAGAAEWLCRSALRETAILEQATQERREAVRLQLLDRVNGLGSRVSLDPGDLFAAAEAIGRNGRVSLAVTLESTRITLVVSHARDHLAPGADRRSASTARDVDMVMNELKAAAPAGVDAAIP